LTLAAWALAVAALAMLGSGIAERLAPTSLMVPGTPSARADAILDREFGSSVPVTVLLEGPRAAIERQGPRLADAFRREGDVQVMSPWESSGGMTSGGDLSTLRPRPDAALIVVNFQRPDAVAMSEVVPAANRIVRRNVSPPLKAHVGGVAAIATALQENALEATHRAELLVAPILVLVLLLVFRTPVAAMVPLLIGAATVLAGRGLLLLSTFVMPINALAVAIASMMGLALGVDYALLMVSRFRQEREAGVDVERAVDIAAAAAGRTIVFAGVTLALAMVTAAMVAPGDLLGSVAAGVVVSTLLSVLLAISLMPALIRVLAGSLDRWRLPSLGRGGNLLGVASRLIARPWIAIPLIVLPMIAIAAPASALSIGPPDPRQLPPSDPTRQGFEALRQAIGPGWAAPIVVVATSKEGSISDPGRLEAISRWQDRVARDPAVAAVIGPTALAETEKTLDRVRGAYRKAPERLSSAQRGISELRDGLHDASDGVAELRDGLGTAAEGAATIAGRTREAQDGAARLEAGLGRASAGAGRLSSGLDRALRGADRLVRGQRRLSKGAGRLARGMRRLDNTLRGSLGQLREIAAQLRAWSAWLRSLRVPTEMAAERLEQAMRELEAMTVGQDDPRYAELQAAIEQASALVGVPVAAAPGQTGASLPAGVPSSLAAAIVGIEEELARSVDSLTALPDRLEQLAAGVSRLRKGADQVAAGTRQSERGSRALRAALRRLAGGGRRLDRGLASARGGGARLAEGLGAIAAGADRLSGGLQDGQDESGELVDGLARPQGPLSRYAMMLHGYGRNYRTLQARSPGAIDSGYLMLTALDGTVPATREQIAQLVNVDGGGQSVRMLVVPTAGPSAPATQQLGDRLQEEIPKLELASATGVEIGEGAQSLADYTDATIARIPWLVAALSIVSILMLMAVLRSLLLPLVAVALNLLTIAAAFGALQLFFGLDLLVGPRYIDAISAAGVLTIMFVLSIDYEVFLLTRMREVWLSTQDHTRAIAEGLSHTAGVITGAAAIMSSVFVVFATADIASLQQFGAGLTFAVVLDATVIRLVLLPAIMRLLGPRAWWLPQWLDRRLPHIDHDISPASIAPAQEVPTLVTPAAAFATPPQQAPTPPEAPAFAPAPQEAPAPIVPPQEVPTFAPAPQEAWAPIAPPQQDPAPQETSAPIAPLQEAPVFAAPTAEIPVPIAPPAEIPPPAETAGISPIDEFEAVAHSEHRRILDLLDELEIAGERRDARRIARLTREVRALAVPHFRYEQRALFPQLIGVLGAERVEWLYTEQDNTVAALERIEVLADRGPLDESEAAEARRLVRAARTSVVGCDTVCENVIGSQPVEVAERVLAARERVLAELA
jgi:RND superfamily putative drug exporter